MDQQYTNVRRGQQNPGFAGQWKARAGAMTLVLLGILCLGFHAEAQSVSHPLSEISTTAKYYSYTYMMSETQKKDIQYIIVLDSKGDAKTVFNACDVCYLSRKGYSQSGTELRCNNCGNRFEIDGLGHSNTGGTCNPGYLPHTIDGGNVVIQVDELIKGEYFFKAQTVTSIDNPAAPVEMELRQHGTYLSAVFPTAVQRSFFVYSITGSLLERFSSAAQTVQINTGNYLPGAYFLAVQDPSSSTVKKFIVQ